MSRIDGDMQKQKLYNVWGDMRRRCSNPNHHAFKHYGKRGIAVCDEWQYSFQSFYNWAIGNGYEPGLTIDREDTNGDYSPDNCRWATMTTQNRNKRNNRNIEHNGETHCLSEWCEILGIDVECVRSRIERGYDEEYALFGKFEPKEPMRCDNCGRLTKADSFKRNDETGVCGICLNHLGGALEISIGNNSNHRESSRPRKSNRIITYQGESKTVAQWADILGVHQDRLYTRLRRGWSVERTLTTPMDWQKRGLEPREERENE